MAGVMAKAERAKQNNDSELGKTQVILGWIAVVCIVALGASICIVGNGIKKYYAAQILRQSLENNRETLAESAISALNTTPTVTKIFLTLIGSAPATPFPGEREQYQRILKLLSELRGRKPEQAAKGIKELDPSILARMIPGADREVINSRLQIIRTKLDLYLAANKKNEEQQNSLYSTGISFGKLRTQFRALAQDFGDLMTLRLEPEGQDTDFIIVYSEGILKDLPRLAYLPDGIKDLPELKQHLDRAKGQVQIQGSNLHQQFTAKIDQLRASSLEIQSQLRTLTAGSARGDSSGTNDPNSLWELRRAAEVAIVALSVDLMARKIDPLTKAFLLIVGV